MNKAKIWLAAFRLRTLPLAFSTVITGSALALAGGFWRNDVFILCLFTTLCLQILSNLANDYGDFVKGTDNEHRVGPARTLQSGALTPGAMKNAIFVFILLSLASGISLLFRALGNEMQALLIFLGLGVASILAALFYTIGKKAYGYQGLGDLFVFLFFGLLGVAGSSFLFSHQFDFLLLLPATGIGALSAAVLNLNNMRDQENDRRSGKNTLVVKLGFSGAKIYHSILLISGMMSFVLWTVLHFTTITQLVFLLFFIPLLLNLKTVIHCEDPKTLDAELKKVALSTFGISLLFFVGIYLSQL